MCARVGAEVCCGGFKVGEAGGGGGLVGVGEPSGKFFAEGGAFGDGGGEAEECATVLLAVPAGGDEVGGVAHGVAGYVGEVFAEGADEDGVAVAEGEAADEDVGYAG